MADPDVVIIGPYPAPRPGGPLVSGVAPYIRQLARHLSDEGLLVRVVAPLEQDGTRFEQDGPLIVHRAFRRGPAALPSALRAAAAHAAPLVHVQHELFLYGEAASVPALLPSLLMCRRSRGCIVTMHQVVDLKSVDPAFTRMHRVRAPAASARACLGVLQGLMPRVSDRVIVHEPAFTPLVPGSVVVPHGTETPPRASKPEARAALGLDGRLTALCFGFVAPYKGIEVALSAGEAARVDVVVAGASHPRLRDGDAYLSSLRARFRRARFTGHVPDRDVATWFAAADVALFLYPKPHATSGAMHLALSHGTPFLLSDALARCTGAPSQIAAPMDTGGLAQRLEQLAQSAAARADLRAACTDMGRQRSWPAVARRHSQIYEEVIDARSPDRGGVRTPRSRR